MGLFPVLNMGTVAADIPFITVRVLNECALYRTPSLKCII